MRMIWLLPAERALLALWVGAMWTTGYLVAPVLFTTLTSKAMAGTIAGRLFGIVGLMGVVVAVLLLLAVLARGPDSWRHWRFWTLLVMLAITAAGQFVILPKMDALKQLGGGIPPGGEIAARFGALHVASTVLFIINSLLGLVLVAAGLG